MMPTLRTVSLELCGSLQVRVAGENHINESTRGHNVHEVVKHGHVEYGRASMNYQIVLVADGYGLLGNGLVPREWLHRQLETLASEPVSWFESCEELVVLWGRKLLGLVSTENVHCTILECTLSLSPNPYTAVYKSHFVHARQTQTATLRLVA